jgi:hypothetical protein
MHDNSIKVNSSTFIGKEIVQVAIGRFSVELVFDGQLRLSCQCQIELRSTECAYEIRSDQPDETSRLVLLLGKKIIDARSSQEGSLLLTFSDGSSLTVENSNDNYESYVVWDKGDFVAV